MTAVVAVVVVVLGGLYLAGYLAAGDRMPKRAQVSGVALGGLSRAQAIDKLRAELGPRAAQPIEVMVADRAATVAAADAGLQIDYAQSVATAGGGEGVSPRRILNVLIGGTPSEVAVVVDQTKLRSAVQRLAATSNRAPVDASLAYAGTEVKQTLAEPGLALREPESVAAIRDGFLHASGAIPLPTEATQPDITDQDAGQVVASFATPAVSAPVTVNVGGGKSFPVTPAMIGRSVTFVPKDGTLAPVVNAAVLRSQADTALKKVLQVKPKDATVRLVNDVPKVIPAVDGSAVNADNLLKAVQPVLAKSGAERTATVELTRTKAAFTADDATKLGIKEVTGRFTTYFPYRAYRNTNIARAAQQITNTMAKPGDTFSLNKAVGPRSKATGFVNGQVIEGGRSKSEMGGEESQIAATTFNALFFAGLKDVQHQPHSVYIDRYPAGREATVDGKKLDLRFRNDTKYGVLVQVFVVPAAADRRGSVTVKIWSTRTYDRVLATPTVRSDVTSAGSVRDGSAGCQAMSAAPGFNADYQRLFYRGDKIVKRQKFHWHYAPANKVTCV